MEITRQDLREMAKDIKENTRESVGRVEQQLKDLNGKVYKHAMEIARHDERIQTLENGQTVDVLDVAKVPEDQQPALTKRDVRLLVGIAGGIAAVVEFAHRVIPYILKAAN